MTRYRYRFLLPLIACPMLSALAGCGSGPSLEEVRERTSSLVKPMITDVGAALEAMARHPTFVALFGELDPSDLFRGEDMEVPPSVTSTSLGAEDPLPPGPEYVEPQPEALSVQAARFADELEAFLFEHVFTEDNLQSSSGNRTTFAIRGETICGQATTIRSGRSGSSGGGATAPWIPDVDDGDGGGAYEPDQLYHPPDPDDDSRQRCIDRVDKLGLLIDARLAGEGIDLDLRVGAADGAVVTIALRPGEVTVRTYLPALARAASDLATALGEKLPDGFPTTMQGILSATISHTDGRLVAKLAVEQTVRIAGKVRSDRYEGELDLVDPLLSVGYSAADDTIDASIDWRATEILLPGNALLREQLVRSLDRPLRLLLSGVKARIKATASGALQIEQLSVGSASQLLLGDDVLAKLDFNPDHDRRATVSVEVVDEQARCSFDPQLDLRADLQFGPLDRYLQEPAPAWAANERYRALLAPADGKLPTIAALNLWSVTTVNDVPEAREPVPEPWPGSDPVPMPEPVPEGPQVLVEVLSGTLTLQSFVNPQQVVVAAGECLLRQEVSDASDDFPLAGLAAGACDAAR